MSFEGTFTALHVLYMILILHLIDLQYGLPTRKDNSVTLTVYGSNKGAVFYNSSRGCGNNNNGSGGHGDKNDGSAGHASNNNALRKRETAKTPSWQSQGLNSEYNAGIIHCPCKRLPYELCFDKWRVITPR